MNIRQQLRIALSMAGQIALLWLASWVGHYAVDRLGLPLPGSVVGVVVMFVLLQTGLVPLHFIEQGAGFLMRHLALFFVPIAVGMMTFGALWLSNGLAILVALIISAAVGFAVTGLLCQGLVGKEVPQKLPAAEVSGESALDRT